MVDASVIGWVSGELLEPLPDALSSFVGAVSGTLIDPPVVLPSMIGAVSGTLTAGGAWAPTNHGCVTGRWPRPRRVVLPRAPLRRRRPSASP